MEILLHHYLIYQCANWNRLIKCNGLLLNQHVNQAGLWCFHIFHEYTLLQPQSSFHRSLLRPTVDATLVSKVQSVSAAWRNTSLQLLFSLVASTHKEMFSVHEHSGVFAFVQLKRQPAAAECIKPTVLVFAALTASANLRIISFWVHCRANVSVMTLRQNVAAVWAIVIFLKCNRFEPSSSQSHTYFTPAQLLRGRPWIWQLFHFNWFCSRLAVSADKLLTLMHSS